MSLQSENSSRALASLRSMLDALEASGGRLPSERELVVSLGVGRRTVRRALEVLETEGLIWRQQGSGTFTGPRPSVDAKVVTSLIKETNLAEVFEARAHLEPSLAGLAALRAQPDDLIRMRDLCDRIAAARDFDARELWDEALHRLIGQVAGNTLLFGVYRILEDVRRDEAWRAMRERARSDAMVAIYSQQHLAIVDAIGRRDPGASEQAMRDHIATLARTILPNHATEVARAG
ncbi:MAG TPA: FCD domain-containing protein [Saliniramus sp.]|nr:FCD domain-containing protein [Saliniramus sp.]